MPLPASTPNVPDRIVDLEQRVRELERHRHDVSAIEGIAGEAGVAGEAGATGPAGPPGPPGPGSSDEVSTAFSSSFFVIPFFTSTYLSASLVVPSGAKGLVIVASLNLFIDNGDDVRAQMRTFDPSANFSTFPDEIQWDPPNVGDFRGSKERTWVVLSPAAGLWSADVQPYNNGGGSSAVRDGRVSMWTVS